MDNLISDYGDRGGVLNSLRSMRSCGQSNQGHWRSNGISGYIRNIVYLGSNTNQIKSNETQTR